MCAYVCVCVVVQVQGVSVGGFRVQQSIGPRELGLQGVVNHLTWVLGLGSLGKQQALLTAEPCL